jgi:hypothetical protein
MTMQKYKIDGDEYVNWDDVKDLIQDTIKRLRHAEDSPYILTAILWLETELEENNND